MAELWMRRRLLPIGLRKLPQPLNQTRTFAHIQGQRFIQINAEAFRAQGQ